MKKSSHADTAIIRHHKNIKIILIISLFLNLLLLIGLASAIYVVRSDDLATARYNYFTDYYCSDAWNERLYERANQTQSQSADYAEAMVATNNYNCQIDGAEEYYQAGLEAYLQSRGFDVSQLD